MFIKTSDFLKNAFLLILSSILRNLQIFKYSEIRIYLEA